MATAPDTVNISGDFAAALHHLNPGKASGPDSICPELVIHAGPGLNFWLRGFLSSCSTQNFKSLEKGVGSCDP